MKLQKKNIKKYRQEIIENLQSLTFAQKRKVLKQADKIVLDNVNYHQGVKYLHTLDYVKRFPSKHQTNSSSPRRYYRNLNEKKFWDEMTKLLDQNKHEEDLLIKMMKIQVKNNNRHTTDYRMIKKQI